MGYLKIRNSILMLRMQKEGDEVMGLGLWVISRGENDAD